MTERMLSAAEVAKQLDRTAHWVNQAAKTGTIAAYKVGRHWKFAQEDVDAYKQSVYSRPADPMAMSAASASRRRVS